MNNRKLKVLFVTHYSTMYGANRSLINLIEGLNDKIIPFVLCPYLGEFTKYLDEHHIRYFVLNFDSWMSSKSIRSKIKAPFRFIKNLLALRHVNHIINENNIDLIYTNSSISPVGIFASIAFKKPHIWHIREFGELDYGLRCDWGKCFFNFFLNKSDCLISISESVKDVVLNEIPSKINVIYNGVATKKKCIDLYEGNRPFSVSEISCTLCIVGGIEKNKCQEDAIYCVNILKKRHKDILLLIAGDGNSRYLQYLNDLCDKLNVKDNVVFLGEVSDPFEVYSKSDIVLMCSKFEGMGRVTAEAMCACRPVVGYNNGGTKEIIDHNYNGFLYNNLEELVFFVDMLITDPSLARRMGENGWDKAVNRYTQEVYSESVFKLMVKTAQEIRK